MSSKTPPPERTLDIAPTARGSCKGCGSPFAEGGVRVAKQVVSAFHDGFSTEYYHPACGHGAKSIELIPNLGSVRWQAQLELLKVTGAKPPSKNAASQKERCDAQWALVDRLVAEAKPVTMQAFMEAQGMSVLRLTKKKNKFELAYEVADALLHGKPGPCPICDGVGTLRAQFPANQPEPTVQCHGFVMGGSRCSFGRAEPRFFGKAGVIRQRVILPDALARKGWFAGYTLPKSVQALPESAAAAAAPDAAAAAQPASAAPAGPAPKKMKLGELKVELTRRGLDVSGKKGELASRLESAMSAEGRPSGAAASAEGGGLAEKPVKRKKLQGHEEALKTNSEAQQEINDQAGNDVGSKVYIGENGTCAYNVTLNQADLSTGVNKYYIIQLLEDKRGMFSLWCKWGRVGGGGGSNRWDESTMLHTHADVGKAIKEFEKKFKDKTGNLWKDRANFQQKGLYAMVLLDGNDNVVDDDAGAPIKRASKKTKVSKNQPAIDAAKKKQGQKKSSLDPRVRGFVKMIFDEDVMMTSMKRQNIDLKKMPLGSLSRRQVAAGYETLCKIQALLEEEQQAAETDSVADDAEEAGIAKERRDTMIRALSNRFYTDIPHVFPEGDAPSIIDNATELRLKSDLIASLEQMQDAHEMQRQVDDSADAEPKEDQNYKSMNCVLKPVEKDSVTFTLISEYVANTHGGKRQTNANSLGPETTLELLEVFEATRAGEGEAYTQDAALLANRKLLWHGSGTGNWGSILKTGLRIAPPEAPSTGWLFGKGLYFANAVGKSAAYCAGVAPGETGVAALLEVALGEPLLVKKPSNGIPKRAEKQGKGHCWAVGKTFPTPPHPTLPDEPVEVPNGKLQRDIKRLGSGKNDKLDSHAMEYDEYIVYRKEQAKVRYVVTMRWGRKDFVDLS